MANSASDDKPPTDILVLGSLSKSPAFFSFDEDDDEPAKNAAPVKLAHDALGVPQMGLTSNMVRIPEIVLFKPSFPNQVAAAAQQMTSFIQPAMPYLMPGLGTVSSSQDSNALAAKVVGRAHEIAQDFPPIWYVNLPTSSMTDARRQELRERVQAVQDFKSWSSLKWWADVFKAVPTTPGDLHNKMVQSSAFAFRAAQEMGRLEWLRSDKPNAIRSQTFECMQKDLHQNIMELAIGTFQGLDEISRRALEPIFKEVLNSASDKTVEFEDHRVVMAEKHELNSSTNKMVSSIRLISFQIGESFYSIDEGKDGIRRMVRCTVEFMQFDAEFDLAIWNRFEGGIAAEQKQACRDFILKRTVDMDRPVATVAGWKLDDDSDCSD
ncbi:hypothetical protein B0H66DRAFT_589647 [Apodospora peruviana]|uniref:Uncharacterized protein n=1 Tax=Apodospora peruviana TaxID=516989 RepID=A0AAE0IBA9_9PEZI|nr:hypothetical protein B0H66DRAFT_589647 [Apodospora peruviana]